MQAELLCFAAMKTRKRRNERLTVPLALAVTVLAAATACGDDDDGKSSSNLVACADVGPQPECVPCQAPDGTKNCAGLPGCFWNEGQARCEQSVA
jgi:hypothetical protein